MNRLKSVFKRLTDREYASAVDQLREDSGMVQSTADQLKKRISELTEAINDGDLVGYDVALDSVRDLTTELAIELKKLNRDAKRNRPQRKALTPKTPEISQTIVPEVTPSSPIAATREYPKFYTEEDVKANAEGVYAEIRNRMPSEHDVPFGPHPAGPKLKSFKWFQQFGPEHVYLKEGGAQDNIFNSLVALAMRLNFGQKLGEDATKDYIKARWPTIVRNIQEAVMEGKLHGYFPSKRPGTGMKTVPIGQIDMLVYTAPFEAIPGYKFAGLMMMKDLTASEPPEMKISVRYVRFMRDLETNTSAGPGTKVSPVRRKETSIPKREEKPKEILPAPPEPQEKKKKSSAVRLELLRSLASITKTAGVDLSASRRLSENFWIKYVQMCQRLGAKPEDLARVINAESGFDPGATNVQGGRIIAKGLNQLIEKTAKHLGMSDSQWDSYEHTPAEQQLEYVEKYFRSVGKATGQDGKWASATQLYVANFAPKYVRKAADPNAILYSSDVNKKEYAHNKGLDRDRKGHITAGDLARSVQGKLPDHIVQAIKRAKQGGQSASIVPTEPANDNVQGLLEALVANVGPVENMVRLAIQREMLPMSSVLVSISSLSAPYRTRMQFAKSAAFVLREMIDADTSLHSDGNKIELQCSAAGSQFAVTSAVNALCKCVEEAVRLKLNQPSVYHAVMPAVFSKYAEIKRTSW
ncbi:MAG TPA: transglycosylase SLT domain-containing protein [Paenisporosarcina sp.]|nr:transglycosylase SLT domain-containing protein [Paenisporosarcina sp.]